MALSTKKLITESKYILHFQRTKSSSKKNKVLQINQFTNLALYVTSLLKSKRNAWPELHVIVVETGGLVKRRCS